MRTICVVPAQPNEFSKTFFPRHVDAYLFAHRSDTHLEDAYPEAYRRAYEDGVGASDRVIGLHCDAPNDVLFGALDGYEAAGCEVRFLVYKGPGEFEGRARYPKNGFMLTPEQAEVVMDAIDDKMSHVGHRPALQEIRNGIAQTLSQLKRLKLTKIPLPL